MIKKLMVKCWLQEAINENATHLIIVLDVPENETYPIYVRNGENINNIVTEHQTGLLKVLEVYKMDMDIEKQYNSRQAFNL